MTIKSVYFVKAAAQMNKAIKYYFFLVLLVMQTTYINLSIRKAYLLSFDRSIMIIYFIITTLIISTFKDFESRKTSHTH